MGDREPYSDYAKCDICGESVLHYEGHSLEDCLRGLVERIVTLEKRRKK